MFQSTWLLSLPSSGLTSTYYSLLSSFLIPPQDGAKLPHMYTTLNLNIITFCTLTFNQNCTYISGQNGIKYVAVCQIN